MKSNRSSLLQSLILTTFLAASATSAPVNSIFKLIASGLKYKNNTRLYSTLICSRQDQGPGFTGLILCKLTQEQWNSMLVDIGQQHLPLNQVTSEKVQELLLDKILHSPDVFKRFITQEEFNKITDKKD